MDSNFVIMIFFVIKCLFDINMIIILIIHFTIATLLFLFSFGLYIVLFSNNY